jgi:hypothetical protein
MKKIPAFIILSVLISFSAIGQTHMMFGDTSRTGSPFSKDPHVIKFGGRYLMYYSIQPYKDISNPVKGWAIGIAESRDLINWKKIGEITPAADYESKGLCAPCARIIDGKVHLFYQTYGNGKNDAICHAVSADGISFTRDATNPVFHPEGPWTCGRAIDAEVIKFRCRALQWLLVTAISAGAPGRIFLSMSPCLNLNCHGKRIVLRGLLLLRKRENFTCSTLGPITMLLSRLEQL